MTDYSEPYWCDEHDPPVKCYEWCPACAEWGEYEVKELTCFKCYHKGLPKSYWKGGNYMIWYKGCEKCSSGVFIQ